ncbi:MAG: isoaspartyl peptidase/L-asparaginase [Nitrospirota bacterium]
MISYGIVVHGGAGSPSHFSDGCRTACEAAFDILEKGRSSMDAVVEAARILEDDGRFNAGSGSSYRLDGRTVEMDASVMDSRGNIGIVMAIKNIKNPVMVAQAVMETPHIALAGEGATVFAKMRGFEALNQVSQYALERYKKVKQMIKEGRLGEEAMRWKGYEIESLWNFEDTSYRDIFCDTIGAVALDKKGVFAVASSTGGFSPMMQGRVGDTPMIGCGFYAGDACAIAVTGTGEEIIKKMLAKAVYDMAANGGDIRSAGERGIKMFPLEIKIGIIGITREGYTKMANTEMASHSLVKEI